MRTGERGPSIAVLDYGIGNLRSAEKALQHVGADARLVTSVADAHAADAVVLPGVGSFGACMLALRASGLDRAVFDTVNENKPFLGVCVGLQLLFERSEESPGVEGLGVLPGEVRRITGDVKLPQMQWNQLDQVRPSALLAGIEADAWAYFVHSYAAEAAPDHVVATCEYGSAVTAVVQRDNVWATQFHPEKSSAVGLQLLKNFTNEVAH